MAGREVGGGLRRRRWGRAEKAREAADVALSCAAQGMEAGWRRGGRRECCESGGRGGRCGADLDEGGGAGLRHGTQLVDKILLGHACTHRGGGEVRVGVRRPRGAAVSWAAHCLSATSRVVAVGAKRVRRSGAPQPRSMRVRVLASLSAMSFISSLAVSPSPSVAGSVSDMKRTLSSACGRTDAA